MNILGFTVKVVEEGTYDDIGAFGKFHPKTMKIQVASDLSTEQKTSTVLHEILEAIRGGLDLDIEHGDINRLEAGLFQALQANGVDLSPLIREIGKSR